MSKFIFTCPQCNQQLEVEEEWIGMQTECPCCKQTITIEKPQAAPATVLKASAPDEKSCPFCGGTIKKEAVFCKHCKKDLIEPKKIKMTCQYCAEEVEIPENQQGNIVCPSCGKSLVNQKRTQNQTKQTVDNSTGNTLILKEPNIYVVKGDYKSIFSAAEYVCKTLFLNKKIKSSIQDGYITVEGSFWEREFSLFFYHSIDGTVTLMEISSIGFLHMIKAGSIPQQIISTLSSENTMSMIQMDGSECFEAPPYTNKPLYNYKQAAKSRMIQSFIIFLGLFFMGSGMMYFGGFFTFAFFSLGILGLLQSFCDIYGLYTLAKRNGVSNIIKIILLPVIPTALIFLWLILGILAKHGY